MGRRKHKVEFELDDDSLASLEEMVRKQEQLIVDLERATSEANTAAEKARKIVRELNQALDKAARTPFPTGRTRQW